jgi:hypothetical protein
LQEACEEGGCNRLYDNADDNDVIDELRADISSYPDEPTAAQDLGSQLDAIFAATSESADWLDDEPELGAVALESSAATPEIGHLDCRYPEGAADAEGTASLAGALEARQLPRSFGGRAGGNCAEAAVGSQSGNDLESGVEGSSAGAHDSEDGDCAGQSLCEAQLLASGADKMMSNREMRRRVRCDIVALTDIQSDESSP